MATHHPAPRQRGSLPLGITLGAIVGAIAVMFVWFALVDDPDSATPAPSQTPTQSVEPSPTPSATPSASVAPSESAPPTQASEPPPGPIPGITTELPVGTWVTVLDSLPKASTTPEQAIERAAALSHPEHQAIVIDTNAFTGLNPNYWAVVIPGAESRAASAEVCKAIGIPAGDKCYPREIKG